MDDNRKFKALVLKNRIDSMGAQAREIMIRENQKSSLERSYAEADAIYERMRVLQEEYYSLLN